MSNRFSKPSRFITYYLNHYRWQLIAGTVFIIFTVFFQLLSPWILRYGVDYIESTSASNSNFLLTLIYKILGPSHFQSATLVLAGIAAAIVVVTILGGFFRFLMRITLIGMSRKIENEIRNDYFSHLLKLSPSFYEHHQTGDLMARATNDLDAVRSMLGPGIMHLISTLLVAIFSVVLMYKIDAYLALWAILPLPVVAIVVNRLLAKIHKIFGRIQAQFAAVTAKVEENLTGIRVVKSYVQENNEIRVFKKLNRELVKRNLSLAKIRAMLRTNIEFILGIGILIVIWVGGIQVIDKKMTIGGLVAFLAYFSMLAWPMIALGWVLNLWQQGLASLKRMLNIWNETPDISDGPLKDKTITQIQGEIVFKNLSFKYEKDGPPILDKIDLKIPVGKTLAIIGPTGSGKSTLVNLIARLYKVPEASLFIDGNDVNAVPLETLRKNIGFVQQESFLFSDTLAENIGFGLEKADIAEIESAAEISQIKLDMDQFPDKFETIVGERGITLSGGQKQRTAISRAVARHPKILILDDALSSVDTYTEEEILKQLKTVMKNRTSIIVAHRISTIRNADFIIVLDEGKIIEQGTHEALLKKKGLYFHLYERQQLEKSLAEL
ncbi:MAG: ATP-binding cassette domain-containing protein [Actinobacteria bacterium]|nr:ATP-binding cassette domain-containing protein [Actinomycetota bacterium]